MVPGRVHPVKELYLEDILLLTKYTNRKMERFKRQEGPSHGGVRPTTASDILSAVGQEEFDQDDADVVVEVDDDTKPVIDQCLSDVFRDGSGPVVSNLMFLYFGDNPFHVPIDYQVI